MNTTHSRTQQHHHPPGQNTTKSKSNSYDTENLDEMYYLLTVLLEHDKLREEHFQQCLVSFVGHFSLTMRCDNTLSELSQYQQGIYISYISWSVVVVVKEMKSSFVHTVVFVTSW